jgi:hypothetical protein
LESEFIDGDIFGLPFQIGFSFTKTMSRSYDHQKASLVGLHVIIISYFVF